jgi:hypothetical protein
VIVSDDGEETELVWLGDGQAIEEDPFGEGEDDGVGTDAECERGDSYGGEAGAAAEHTDGVTEIGAKLVEETEAEGGADVLFVGFDVAELYAGAAKSFGRGEAGALQVFGAELDVGAEFGFDAGLDGVAAEEGVEIGAKFGLHGWSSSRGSVEDAAMREALIQLWDLGRELVATLAVRFLLEFLGEFSGRSPRLSRRAGPQ